MLFMVVMGVTLRFIQESRADKAAAALKAMIKVTTAVLRDGQEVEIPLKVVVPGDIVKLAAGDMILPMLGSFPRKTFLPRDRSPANLFR